MKQITNILAFFFVLSIPFALSSQTRKAIPAGRYEALSGIKNMRLQKANNNEKKDIALLFWGEVLNRLPPDAPNPGYFIFGKLDESINHFLISKGVKLTRQINTNSNILISDNLERDKKILKTIQNKKNLLVLRDARDLKSVMSSLSQYEVLLYQSDNLSNYFLLKLRK